MFKPVSSKLNVNAMELSILRFLEKGRYFSNIDEKSRRTA